MLPLSCPRKPPDLRWPEYRVFRPRLLTDTPDIASTASTGERLRFVYVMGVIWVC
jgi:hypothetical protein